MSSIRKRKFLDSLGMGQLVENKYLWGISYAYISFNRLILREKQQINTKHQLANRLKKKILIQECGTLLEYFVDTKLSKKGKKKANQLKAKSF